MNKRLKTIVVSAAASIGTFIAPAQGSSLLTYTVEGTFTDGGTFSGTFGYDPTTNAFYDSPLGDQFSIATTAGSQGQANTYLPFQTPLLYSDEQSTATELHIFGAFGANGGEQSNFILNWSTALNAAGGGGYQSITGGSEIFAIAVPGCAPASFCVTYPDNRQVATGFVELQSSPVPLPSSAWLTLSALLCLAAFTRKPDWTCRFPRW